MCFFPLHAKWTLIRWTPAVSWPICFLQLHSVTKERYLNKLSLGANDPMFKYNIFRYRQLHRMMECKAIFIAPSLILWVDQAADAHATRAPALVAWAWWACLHLMAPGLLSLSLSCLHIMHYSLSLSRACILLSHSLSRACILWLRDYVSVRLNRNPWVFIRTCGDATQANSIFHPFLYWNNWIGSKIFNDYIFKDMMDATSDQPVTFEALRNDQLELRLFQVASSWACNFQMRFDVSVRTLRSVIFLASLSSHLRPGLGNHHIYI